MQSLITSFLILNKKCDLPGIGVLKIIHTPASTDYVSNQLLPPFETVIFSKGDNKLSADLTQFIARKKQVTVAEAEQIINSFCSEWKVRIEDGESLVLDAVGFLTKNNGDTFFTREKQFDFFKPITIEKAYKKEDNPSQTVAPVTRDIVLDTPTADESYVVEKSYWGLWALILLAIGLVILFYNFKDRNLTGASSGNQNKILVDSARSTYSKP